MAADDAIYDELVRLRRGRALQGTTLSARVGPRLAAACRIAGADPDRVVRQKVTNLIRTVTRDFPPDLLLAAQVAFAIHDPALFPRLEEREEWLAGELRCSLRSARRRVAEATERLAEAVRDDAREDRPDDPEQGWYVSHLRALLNLDTPVPELYEERTIVAMRDELTQIRTRFSLPRPDGAGGAGHRLVAEVLHGALLEGVERIGETHFRFVLQLPRALRPGDELSYTIRYRIPPGQPMTPHLAIVPLMPCASFQARVRFDPQLLPEVVWRLDRVPPRLIDERPADAPLLVPDTAGDIGQEFTNLAQGYGYGVAWRPGLRPEAVRDIPGQRHGVSGSSGDRQRETW